MTLSFQNIRRIPHQDPLKVLLLVQSTDGRNGSNISEKDKLNNTQRISVNSELLRLNKDVLDRLGDRDVFFRFPPLIKGTQTALVLKTPKTESSIRHVYIPDTVANMLRKRKAVIREEKDLFQEDYIDYDLVFCNSLGRPMEQSLIERAFSKLIREAGLKKVVFHSMRHTSVTYKLKMTGGDVKSVQGDSGHSQANMVTDVYSHILDEDRKRNAELFEETFYQKKETDPHPVKDVAPTVSAGKAVMDIPEGMDPEMLQKVLANPEMAALLSALVKSMENQ